MKINTNSEPRSNSQWIPRSHRQVWIAVGLFSMFLVLNGCANTGVANDAVISIAGAKEDAELYHESKLDSDSKMLSNLAIALHKVSDLEARLVIEQKSVDGKIGKSDATLIVRGMHDDLLKTYNTLIEIKDSQLASEIHYQSLRAILRATIGVVAALADREQSEQKLKARGIEAIEAGADAVKRAGTASSTGGIIR